MKKNSLISLLFINFILLSGCSSSKKVVVHKKIKNTTMLRSSHTQIPEWIGTFDAVWKKDSNLCYKVFVPDQRDIKNGMIKALKSRGTQEFQNTKNWILSFFKKNAIGEKKPLLKIIKTILHKLKPASFDKISAVKEKYWEYTETTKKSLLKRNFTIYLLTSIKMSRLQKLITETIKQSGEKIPEKLSEEWTSLLKKLFQQTN